MKHRWLEAVCSRLALTNRKALRNRQAPLAMQLLAHSCALCSLGRIYDQTTEDMSK